MSMGYSFFVTIPIDWINYWELRKRDNISFSLDEENNLVLRPFKGGIHGKPK